MLEFVALAVSFGVVLSRGMNVPFWGTLVVVILVVAIIGMTLRTIRGIVCALCIGSAIVAGALLFWHQDTPLPRGLLGDRAFDATVVTVNRQLDKMTIVARDVRLHTHIQATIPSGTTLLPGDYITLRGTVELPKDFVTDSGRMFGYREYLESKGIDAIIRRAQVVLVEAGSWSLSRMATQIRFAIADTFSRYFSFPVDGIVSGMLVGYQGGLPQSIQDLFRVTGVLHVLVLSGTNITLLALFLSIVLKRVPFRIRTVLTAVAIVLIVLISGAGVAAIRAGIMGSIALVAGLTRRKYAPLRALVITYLLFLFISPGALIADPGFHLSFLATFFMIAIMPKADAWFAWLPSRYSIRELTVLAVCVPLFMLPYTMYFSGLVPLASVPANILLAIATPLLMLIGAVVLALSWVPALAQLIGTLGSMVGTAVVWVLKLCTQLPSWQAPEVPWWLMLAVYSGSIGVLFYRDISAYVVQFGNSLRR